VIDIIVEMKSFEADWFGSSIMSFENKIREGCSANNMIIYHITSRAEWEKARLAGQYIAPSLVQEGFIHASTGEQVAGTANLFFKEQTGLVLLVIETGRLQSEVRFDAVQTHGTEQFFPHIYGPINLDAVDSVLDFSPNADGSFTFNGK
jgi:uncharacterized protein (DUF952 family)